MTNDTPMERVLSSTSPQGGRIGALLEATSSPLPPFQSRQKIHRSKAAAFALLAAMNPWNLLNISNYSMIYTIATICLNSKDNDHHSMVVFVVMPRHSLPTAMHHSLKVQYWVMLLYRPQLPYIIHQKLNIGLCCCIRCRGTGPCFIGKYQGIPRQPIHHQNFIIWGCIVVASTNAPGLH